MVEQKNTETSKALAEAESEASRLRDTISGLVDEQQKLQTEMATLRAVRADLIRKVETAVDRLELLERVVAPRLKSIVTLRPLRFALRQRNQIKRNEIPAPDQLLTELSPYTHDLSQFSESDQKEGDFSPTVPSGETEWGNFGIAVFGHTRVECIRNTLESLARQDALHITHVFLDGDQGKSGLRYKIDEVYDIARAYPVARIHKQRSAFGFRKMMLTAGRFMLEHYERMLFLEDDCFPVNNAVAEFNRELDLINDDPNVFSVYGHHFLVPGEDRLFPRFQSWGWASTRQKMAPVWSDLQDCYLMSEEDYLHFIETKLTREISDKIDATPGRQPTTTLTKFFAWDETVCLLTALRNQTHKKSDRRLIYNCGAGLDSSHFRELAFFREPPFNMVGANEVWEHF